MKNIDLKEEDLSFLKAKYKKLTEKHLLDQLDAFSDNSPKEKNHICSLKERLNSSSKLILPRQFNSKTMFYSNDNPSGQPIEVTEDKLKNFKYSDSDFISLWLN